MTTVAYILVTFGSREVKSADHNVM